jgi:type IV pilus assembly protein PilB
VPVKADGDRLYVAMSDPLDFIAIEDAKMVSGLEVMP